jgi:polyisoprenoid-binding protein YceI
MKFTMWSIAMLGGAAAATQAIAQGGQPANGARLLPAQSEIVFVSHQMGVPVEGKFAKFDAQIALDPKRPDAGKVLLTIDTSSASVGFPETDAELVKPNWFNSAKAPPATFQSNSIRSLGNGRFEVTGMLSIKGIAQKLVVPVTVTQAGATSTATGSFAIKRLDYRIGEAEWADTSIVGNDVEVRFKLALTGMAAL